ncbi:MAG: ATP-binding protein [Polyangiaceae bacterium]
MAARPPIRHRLLTILLLGALVSALSVAALARLLTVSTQHRIERASEEVRQLLVQLSADRDAMSRPAPGNVVGMRAGLLQGGVRPIAPSHWLPEIERALLDQAQASPRVTQVDLGKSTLVVGTVRAQAERVAWAAIEVRPLPHLEAWKLTIWLLAAATLVLVVTTARAAAAMQRGAGELGAALGKLATDLDAPIPRPALRELSDVAEGIARLSKSLADARREEARLADELSQNERLAALGRVAAGVAHEVRNPLASIKLRLDLAVASTRLPDSVSDAIAHATSEIVRLDRLVADLLVVSGRSTGPRSQLSLRDLARSRTEALRLWAAERGVAFTLEGDARVNAHADSLARALDNLLRNAVEASSRGDAVSVEIEERDGRSCLSVCDHGAGVEARRVTELFEPFFTTKPDGTGLGLPLARSIARAHGGDVRHSRVGDVTRFELELPALGEESTRALAASHQLEGHVRG